jgi:hypothetical protein
MPRKPDGTKPETDAPQDHSFSEQFAANITREDLRRSFRSGRSYIWPPNGAEGEVQYYVSVTNALNGLPKDALPRWAAKLVAEHAVDHFRALDEMMAEGDRNGAINWLKAAPWAKRDDAADTGTAVHLVAELYIEGKVEEAEAIAKDLDKSGQAKARQVMHFFREVPLRIDMSEAVVYNDTFKYAGTLDLIGTILDDELLKLWPGMDLAPLTLVLDIKTGKGVYDEVALQLAAYRYAEKVVELESATLEPMIETQGGGVIHVTEDGWELIPVDTSKETFRKFCRTLALSVELPISGLIGTPALRGNEGG